MTVGIKLAFRHDSWERSLVYDLSTVTRYGHISKLV
jgi:hypothetical protein